MCPEGECCTATMESGTLCVLMTGIQQGMRPELSVTHWDTTTTTTVGSFVTHFSIWYK